MTQHKPQDEDLRKEAEGVLGRIPLLRPEWERAVLPWDESRVRAADPDLADVLADLDAKALSVMKATVKSGNEATAIVTATAAARPTNEPLANLFERTQSLQDLRAELRRTLDEVGDRLPEEGPFAEDARRVRTWAELALGISESETVAQPGIVNVGIGTSLYHGTERDVDETLKVLGLKRHGSKRWPGDRRTGLWNLFRTMVGKHGDYVDKPKSEYRRKVAQFARFDFLGRWVEDSNRLGLTPKDSRKRQRPGQPEQQNEDSQGDVGGDEAEKPTLTKELRNQLNSEAGDSGEVEAESQTFESAYQRELLAAIEAAMQGARDDEIDLLHAVLRNGGEDWSAALRELGKTRATEKKLRRRLEKSEELRGLVEAK